MNFPKRFGAVYATLFLVFSTLGLRAQTLALHHFSNNYVAATGLALEGLSAGLVPFSDRDPRSPKTGYTGTRFYGGAFLSNGLTLNLWDMVKTTTQGDGPRFGVPAGTGTADTIFLFEREDFLVTTTPSSFQNTNIDLSNATGSSLKFRGRTSATSAATARYIVQDNTGKYFISSTIYTLATSSAENSLATSSEIWLNYDPYTNTIGASTPVPNLNRIFAAGVRVTLTASSAAARTAELHQFKVTHPGQALTNIETPSTIGLTGFAVSPSRVNLKWNGGQSGAKKYIVYRDIISTGSLPPLVPFPPIAEVTVNGFCDYRLEAGKSYYYKIAVVLASADGDPAHDIIQPQSNLIRVATDAAEAADLTGLTHARHPSIHFTAKEIAELQARTLVEPWKSWYGRMKTRITDPTKYPLNSAKSPSNYKDPSIFINNPSNSHFIDCKNRGDAVVALATVWLLETTDLQLKADCLAALKLYFMNMPAPPAALDGPNVQTLAELLTPTDDGVYPTTNFYYASSLYLSYAAWGYALAYDIVYPALTADERALYQNKMRRHAMALYGSISEPLYKDHVDYKINNWVEVMAAGLAETGMAIRDYKEEGGTEWGQAFLQKAYDSYTRVLNNPVQGMLDIHVKGQGAFMEGETYSAFTGYWASEGLHALRVANFSGVDLFSQGKYQSWLKYRLKNLTTAGNTVLFEAAREVKSDSNRWVGGYLTEVLDADSQSQLRWLRAKLLVTPATDMDAAFFRYLSGPTPTDTKEIIAPIIAGSFVDPGAGLAIFRRSTSTGNLGDDANTITLAVANKPYPGTLPNPKYNPLATDPTQIEHWPRIALKHTRDLAGAFELWAYGAYASNEPGYYTGITAPINPDHGDWVTTNAEAHNTLKIGNNSPHRFVNSDGFKSWSTGRTLEFVSGLVSRPYKLSEAQYLADEATNGIADLPTLPSGGDSLLRTLLFVTPPPGASPTAGNVAYAIAFDDVQSDTAANEVRWHIHGMASGSNLAVSGQQATWSAIPVVATATGSPAPIAMKVYVAVPHNTGATGSIFAGQPPSDTAPFYQSQPFLEYWRGNDRPSSTGTDADFAYVKRSGSTVHNFLAVLYPYKNASNPATIADLVDDNNPTIVTGAKIGNFDFAATKLSGGNLTAGGITILSSSSSSARFFARKNSGTPTTLLDCYFAEDVTALQYSGNTHGFAAPTMVDICIDKYDSVKRTLGGTVAYNATVGSWSLTLKDPGLPASGGSVVLTAAVGTPPPPPPSVSCSLGQVVIGNLPAGVNQFDITVAY